MLVYYAYVKAGVATELPRQGPIEIEGNVFPHSIFSFDEDSLAQAGIYPIIDEPPVCSENEKVVGTGGLQVFETNGKITVKRGYIVVPLEPDDIRPQILQAIDARRDELIDSGFTFEGKLYQSRPSDRENIAGASQAAFMAKAAGIQPGDLYWADPSVPFGWITADNSVVMMDTEKTMALFTRGVAFKRSLTFFAKQLKDWVRAPERTLAELRAFDLDSQEWPE